MFELSPVRVVIVVRIERQAPIPVALSWGLNHELSRHEVILHVHRNFGHNLHHLAVAGQPSVLLQFFLSTSNIPP